MTKSNKDLLEMRVATLKKTRARVAGIETQVGRYGEYLENARVAYEAKKSSLLSQLSILEQGKVPLEEKVAGYEEDVRQMEELLKKLPELELKRDKTLEEFHKQEKAINEKYPWPENKPHLEKIEYLRVMAGEFAQEIEDISKKIRKVYYK